MKKAAKNVLRASGATVLVIALALCATTIVNVVATNAESGRIEPYGRSVTVDGRRMNVEVTGDGPQNVVLLPGFGTSSPVLDLEPLVADLALDHRVIVVEPFGYGLSDGTDRDRTTANIVTEVHEALRELRIDRYVLMGHSIAGIYAIEYANRYPDEVTAFVGIDSSVPGQPGMDMSFPIGLFSTVKHLGLSRLLAAFGDGGYGEASYSDHARDQLAMFGNRNSLGPTYLNEMAHIRSNFETSLDTSFAPNLPLLLFVVAENTNTPDWIRLHEQQAAAVDDGTVVPIAGEHYLHHTHAPEIATEFREWWGAREW